MPGGEGRASDSSNRGQAARSNPMAVDRDRASDGSSRGKGAPTPSSSRCMSSSQSSECSLPGESSGHAQSVHEGGSASLCLPAW